MKTITVVERGTNCPEIVITYNDNLSKYDLMEHLYTILGQTCNEAGYQLTTDLGEILEEI